MGLVPSEINSMSLWEFMACSDGYLLSNDPKAKRRGQGELSDDDLAAMGIEGFD